jgi:hypothetical protein
LSDEQIPACQPATSDEIPGTPLPSRGPELTRRNFVYGSAAAAAAVAFLRDTGFRPGHNGGLMPVGLTRGDQVQPLQSGGPYLIGSASAKSTTLAVTVSTASHSGDAIVICAAGNGGDQVASIADSEGNAYTQRISENSTNTTITGSIWTSLNPTPLAVKKKVTVTFNGGSTHNVFVVGVPGATAVDVSVAAANPGTAPTATPSATISSLSAPNEPVVAMEVNADGSGPITWSSTTFTPLENYGGGTITMVDIAPGGGTMVAGGDVEGFLLSSYNSADQAYGDQWAISNTGLYGTNWRECACIAWSQLEPSTIYACTGRGQDADPKTNKPAYSAGGGFVVSTDGGNTWTLRSGANNAEPQFSGGDPSVPLPDYGGYPRSTGNLLVQQETASGNKYLYAASYSAGVYSSADLGVIWSPLFPLNASQVPILPDGTSGTPFCRSLAFDSANSILYVSLFSGSLTNVTQTAVGYGVWKANIVNGAVNGSWTKISGAAQAVTEELLFLDGFLYAACGAAGLYIYAPSTGVWTTLNDGTFVQANQAGGHNTADDVYWKTLSGYVVTAGQKDIIVAFADNAVGVSSGGYRSIVQGTVTGLGSTPTASYTDLTAGVTSDFSTIASSGEPWWKWNPGGYELYLNGAPYINAHITIDQSTTPPTVYATGSSGVYRQYWPSGTTQPFQWQVAINGMELFVGRSVQIDPVNELHIVFGDSDYCSWDITDGVGYGTNAQTTPAVATQAFEGYALAFDPEPPASPPSGIYTLFLSAGVKYQATGGSVYGRLSATEPPTAWTDTGLGSATVGTESEAGDVAIGLAVVRDSATPASNQYVLAAVEQTNGPGGLWLMVNGGTWIQVDTTIGTSNQSTSYMPFAVPASPLPAVGTTPYPGVYVFDRGAGEVFRGAPSGSSLLRSWTSIWSAGGPVTDSRSGFVALNPVPAEPSLGDELWISTPGGLVMFAGANNGGKPQPIGLPAGTIPGAIAFTPDGVVYVISLGGPPPAPSPDTRLLRSPNGGQKWVDVTGPAPGLASNVSYPTEMAIAPDGRIYICNAANVCAQGYPGAGWTELGSPLHTAPAEYSSVAAQVVASTGPVTATGQITSGQWLMLATAFEV